MIHTTLIEPRRTAALEDATSQLGLWGGPNGAEAPEVGPVERFTVAHDGVIRHVARRDGSLSESLIPGPVSGTVGDPEDANAADRLLLRLPEPPPRPSGSDAAIVDLFSGSGGLTLGVGEALRALNIGWRSAIAADLDEAALSVYAHNFPETEVIHGDVASLVDGSVGDRLTPSEQSLRDRAQAGTVILLGGPPCEGHSAFNNRTRHVDSRNELYFRMVRAAQVLEADHVIVENVQGALRDRDRVVQRSIEAFLKLGYEVSHGVVELVALGVPQTRKRLILVASRRRISVEALPKLYATPRRTVRWAIEDLHDAAPDALLDQTTDSAPDTRKRIDYLFDHDLFELPDSERPPCHSGGGHSYKSIYGRLRWDEPAQTITSGFYSMCMGRYVHPSQRRAITAHEAARLQFLPDYFRFDPLTKRGKLAQVIGDAVPLKLGYATALELLR